MRKLFLAAGLVATSVTLIAAVPQHSARADIDLRAPSRILDTRAGLGAPRTPLTPGATLRLDLPPDVVDGQAVALNLTTDRAAAPGWVSAWSCADPQPTTSIVNFVPGRPAANMVALRSTDAGLCFAASTTVDLIADVTAVMDAGDYTGVAPVRLLDTRATAPLVARQEYPLDVARRAAIPANAAAGALNVTVVSREAPGWLAVTPCGAPAGSSTVNFAAGEAVAHFTFTGLTAGRACLTASTAVDVVVDAFGWLPADGALDALAPTRALDTRNGVGGHRGALADGEILRVRVAGYGGVPNDAAGATVNVVAVDSGAWGHVNAWPCDAVESGTSTVNMWPGATRANQATLALSAGGELCLRPKLAGGRAHLVVDVVGAVAGSVDRPEPPPTTPPPAPPSERFTTLPVGSALPSGAECAGRVRPAPEIRPGNAGPNSTRGSAPDTRSDWVGFQRVDGDFVGTTDEIIQWAACKWGIDEDIVRAQVVKESFWHQAAVGDNGESFGLGQVRRPYHGSAFVDENAARSSAYNLDYTYAVWRACYEGVYTWLNDVERGRNYAAGDEWGCLGVWFSGRWYTPDAVAYIEGGNTGEYGSIGVRQHLTARTWETPEFIGAHL